MSAVSIPSSSLIHEITQASRVNGRLLHKYAGQIVSIVGRIIANDSQQTATILASDNQQVRIIYSKDNKRKNPFQLNSIVEIIGKVNSDNTLGEIDIIEFSPSFNVDVYDTLLKKMQRVELKTIFS